MGPRSAGSRSSCRIFSTVGQSRESWRICSQRLLVTKIYVGQCSSIQCLWRNGIESNNRQFTASMRIRCSDFPFIHSFYIYIYGQIDNSRFQIRFSSVTFFKVIFRGEVRAWKWKSNISNERVANNGEGTFYYRVTDVPASRRKIWTYWTIYWNVMNYKTGSRWKNRFPTVAFNRRVDEKLMCRVLVKSDVEFEE